MWVTFYPLLCKRAKSPYFISRIAWSILACARRTKSIRFLYPLFKGSVRRCPLLRASNEHIPIVRVLRARRAPGRSLPPLLPSSLVISQGWGLIDLLLRASNDINAPSKLACFSLGRAPTLVYVRPSNEALLRARVPGAQDQCGCPSSPL
jgi:hypothetical protein